MADRGEGRCQHDEARACYAGGSLRSQQQNANDAQLLSETQVCIGRLREEQRSHREIDAGPVEIEGVPGWDDETNDRLLTSEILHFRDHARQHRLGRGGAQHDQQLFLDVADELEDVEAREPSHAAQDKHDEDNAGQIERSHEVRKRDQRYDTVLADGEGHGPERADWSGLHDDADDGKQRVTGLIDEAEHDLSALTDHLQAKRKQDCEEKHLQDLALSECPHHRVGDDVHQKLDCALLLGLRYQTLDSSGVDRAGVDIHGGAWLQRVGDNEPHDEGKRR